MEVGIGFYMKGACQNCEFGQPFIDRKEQPDGSIRFYIRCVHDNACKRIAALIAKDRQVPDIIKKE